MMRMRPDRGQNGNKVVPAEHKTKETSLFSALKWRPVIRALGEKERRKKIEKQLNKNLEL